MNKRKILKAIYLILIGIAMLMAFYNLGMYFSTGNLEMNVEMSSTYYCDSDINALISVNKNEDNKQVKSTVKAQIYNDEDKKVKGTKTTLKLDKGENGNLEIKIPDDLETGEYTLKLKASSGFQKIEREIPINIITQKDSNIIVSLDKGIYKPGDQINYRTLIVSNKDYTPVKDDVNIYIYDGNDNKVYSETVETSEYGIVSGSFKLADEVNSGTYKISVVLGTQEYNKTFTVNPYITPKFETEIITDKESYLVGEEAQITILGKYFFGEPVVNANVVGKINNEDVMGITNEEGKFVTTYKFEEAGKLNLDFTITDTSNYVIEANKTISCGTDIFEIEVLPEYGSIINGVDNEIYIITKDANGTPVKTYSYINIGTISKQVISDENGMGKFVLTSNEVAELVYEYERIDGRKEYITYFDITSENMNKESISKKIGCKGNERFGTILKTDKMKYNEGDDITVTVDSNIDSTSNQIYVYKNKQLLRTLSFEENETVFNLDNTSGLIDIYVKSTNNSYNKRTIFVKPNKQLNIGIKTNSNEYKPGDKLKIQFTTTDEDNQSIDSALLVSILDDAILKLAENDLSIDNIKLALQDIQLTEEFTAADLYASVLDDSSEITLKTILLKQSSKHPNIISEFYRDYDYLKDEYLAKAVLIVSIILITVIIYCILKSKKAKDFIIAIIDTFAIFVTILTIMNCIDDWYYVDTWIIFGVSLVISVILYVLVLYQEKAYIFKLIKELVIIPLITIIAVVFINELFYDIFDIEIYGIILLVIGLFSLSMFAYTTALIRDGQTDKFSNRIRIYSSSIVKAFVFYISCYLLTEIFEIGFLIVLFVYILFDRIIFNKKAKEAKINDGQIVLKITTADLVAIVSGILLVLIVGIYTYYSAENAVNQSLTSGGIIYEEELDMTDTMLEYAGSDSEHKADDFTPQNIYNSASDTTETTNGLGNIMNSLTTFGGAFEEDDTVQENILSSEVEKNIKNEESVRNVFLESLAFIPELVTENGKAETTIDISDNITTWNIQILGNTKQGNLGYATSSFKVFKEFFVDFSVPNNLVVTDKVSIPVTLYNYTENDLNIDVKVVENDWSKIGDYVKVITVPAQSTNMIYVPIEILKAGNNVLRIETKSENVSDIVEKTAVVKINGFEKQEVISSGIIEKDYTQDIIFNDEAIENTKKLKVKLYPVPVAQAVEGIENVLQMPTGCFEQTSSSLYPDILVLKYLKNNNIDNKELEQKALEYISKGYQKLLTYEVKGEKGGYSLYGNSPAETVITAFGLMEFNELSTVYDIDENVINDMKEYLFKEQKSNGTFKFSSTYIGNAANTNDLSMNAYITWALSEVCPDDKRLEKSVEYFEENLNRATDPYTLALIANIFVNTDSGKTNEVIKELKDKITTCDTGAYISSDSADYYGTRGKYQNIQATALTSIAFSKLDKETKNNAQLVNYLVSVKDSRGTWGTTQSTILALKAINDFSTEEDIKEQTLIVECNGNAKEVKINNDTLDFYEFEFDNISTENNVSIKMKKGKLTYEIIKEYYLEYSKINNITDIKINQEIDAQLKVNDTINQKIEIINSNQSIANALVQINIPQGASVVEESLLNLKYNGIIEKYEYNYSKVNIYLRNVEALDVINLNLQYKALYPSNITGTSIRFYDYYNPEIEAITLPVNIIVTE